MTIVLWIVQGLLSLAFLLAGVMKTFMPLEGLKKNMAWVGSVPAGGNRARPGDGKRGGVPHHPQRIQRHRREHRAATIGCFYCSWVSGLGSGRVASLAKGPLSHSPTFSWTDLQPAKKSLFP